MVNISLVTIETVHRPLVSKTIGITFLNKLNTYKDKLMNNTKNILVNNNFKKTVFTLMIISTIIINSGYIQSRDSSKIDY